MTECLSHGTIWKGSVAQATVCAFPICNSGVTNLKLDFFTTSSGTSVEFSGSSITLSGNMATVVFQAVQLEVLADGLLKYISHYTMGGEEYVWQFESRLYVKTPNPYTPINFQEKLTAGNGIEISGNTISCTVTGGTSYVAGDNISISGNVISATDTTYVAGTGIEISGNTINCTVSGGTSSFQAGRGIYIEDNTINAEIGANYSNDSLYYLDNIPVELANSYSSYRLSISNRGNQYFRYIDGYNDIIGIYVTGITSSDKFSFISDSGNNTYSTAALVTYPTLPKYVRLDKNSTQRDLNFPFTGNFYMFFNIKTFDLYTRLGCICPAQHNYAFLKNVLGQSIFGAGNIAYSGGTGIEISGNTINCTVSGGGGECNYHIVQDLSAITAPTEGTMAYVNSGIGIDTWEGYSFDGSSISEGYVVSINKPNVGNINIYRSGTNFYWDWENDEQLHKKSVNNISVLYQAFQNGTFKIAIEDWTDISINVENGVTSATTSLTYSYDVYAQSYLYENSSWNKAYLLSYNFSNMTNAQIGQVISKMLADNENNRCVYNIYYDGYKLLYKYTETSKIWFTGTKTDVWSSDKIKLIQVTFNISGERGDYEEYSNGLGGPAGLQINTSTHNAFWIGNSFPVSGLQNGEKNKSFIAYGGDNNPSSEGTYSSGHYQFKTCDTWVKEYWDEDESRWRLGEFVGAIGAHFYYRDKEVYAEWKFVENTITNIKWTETTVS